MTYKSLKDLANAAFDLIDPLTQEGKDLGVLINLYFNAKEQSKAMGYVGVGCITYAENCLIDYQENKEFYS